MNYAMASPEAMTGNVSNKLLPMSAVVPCGWSVFLSRYSPAFADISTALSRLAGKEPMLTRSKIRD